MEFNKKEFYIKELEKLNDNIIKNKICYKFLYITFCVLTISSISYTKTTIDSHDDAVAALTSSICFTLTNAQGNILNDKKERKKFLQELLKNLENDNNEQKQKIKKLDIKI